MNIEDAFQDALDRVQGLPNQPPNTLLKLYGLYKQSTEGDVSGSRPGALDFKGRAKWDAWNERKGLTHDAAMQAYINYVDELGA